MNIEQRVEKLEKHLYRLWWGLGFVSFFLLLLVTVGMRSAHSNMEGKDVVPFSIRGGTVVMDSLEVNSLRVNHIDTRYLAAEGIRIEGRFPPKRGDLMELGKHSILLEGDMITLNDEKNFSRIILTTSPRVFSMPLIFPDITRKVQTYGDRGAGIIQRDEAGGIRHISWSQNQEYSETFFSGKRQRRLVTASLQDGRLGTNYLDRQGKVLHTLGDLVTDHETPRDKFIKWLHEQKK